MRNKSAGLTMLGLLLGYAHACWPQPISRQDCAAIFPYSDEGKNTRVVENLTYCEAWDQGAAPGEEKLLGYVFREPLPQVAQQAYLLVGVTKAGEIARVQTPGAEGISSDFLAQFAHRSLQSNWEIASQPEDLLFVPVALRAMRGKPELSESVVLAVKAIMDLVNKKLLKLNVRS